MPAAPTLEQENSSTMIELVKNNLQFTLIILLGLFPLLCLSVMAGEIGLSSIFPHLPFLPLSSVYVRMVIANEWGQNTSCISSQSHGKDRITRKFHSMCSHAAHC